MCFVVLFDSEASTQPTKCQSLPPVSASFGFVLLPPMLEGIFATTKNAMDVYCKCLALAVPDV